MTKEAGFSIFRIHTETVQEAINNTERDIQDYNEWLGLQNCACAQVLLTGGEFDLSCCSCDEHTQLAMQETAENLTIISSDIIPQTSLTIVGIPFSLRGRPGIPPTVDYELYRSRQLNTPTIPSTFENVLTKIIGVSPVFDTSIVSATTDYTVRVEDERYSSSVNFKDEEVLFDSASEIEDERERVKSTPIYRPTPSRSNV